MYDFSFLQEIEYQVCDKTLSCQEIIEYEELNNIVLPNDYKYFLMNIGNGIKIHFAKTDHYIKGIKRPISKRYNKRLARTFIFNEAYHKRLQTHNFEIPSDCPDPQLESDDYCNDCLHFYDCFWAFPENAFDDYNHMIYNGTYPICYAGCTYTYFLIITGQHRGEVWINNETSDFAPAKNSFISFLQWIIESNGMI